MEWTALRRSRCSSENSYRCWIDEERLGFDLIGGKLSIDISSLDVKLADVLAAIERTGLKAEPWQDANSERESSFWSQHRRTMLTTVSGVFGVTGLVTQLMLSGGTSVTGESRSACGRFIVRGRNHCRSQLGTSQGIAFRIVSAPRHEPADDGCRRRCSVDWRVV